MTRKKNTATSKKKAVAAAAAVVTNTAEVAAAANTKFSYLQLLTTALLFIGSAVFYKLMTFQSKLPSSFRDDLQELLFFNPRQSLYRVQIEKAIDDFGMPTITEQGEHLHIACRNCECQTLFAVDAGQLLGVLIYTRLDAQKLAVVHIATHSKLGSQQAVGLILVEELLRLGKRIKGIERLIISYGQKGERSLRIRA